MKLSAAFFVLFIIVIPLAVSPILSQAQSTQTAAIVVQVKDQNNAWYDGVLVQVWEQPGPFEGSGTINNGTWTSAQVPAFESYVVEVSNGVSSKNQTVQIQTNNVFVSFNLSRPFFPSLSISNVSFQPSIVSPGTTFQALLTVASSTNSTAYDALINLNATSSPSGISISGEGTSI
ncbi:MAG: hypothetical protein ACHQ1H_10490, partial [Nitrososphaerales archaeon]